MIEILKEVPFVPDTFYESRGRKRYLTFFGGVLLALESVGVGG